MLALWGPLNYFTMPMAAHISIYTLSLGPYALRWRRRRARPYIFARSFKFFTSAHQGLGERRVINPRPPGGPLRYRSLTMALCKGVIGSHNFLGYDSYDSPGF